jgi:hypothetical protein
MVIRDPDDRHRADDRYHDEKARKAATLATILAAVAGVIALIALIYALSHDHEDKAPQNCDPATDYVCRPEVVQETKTTDVPTTSMSPSSTEVPVPGTTQSEIVTTTVRP